MVVTVPSIYGITIDGADLRYKSKFPLIKTMANAAALSENRKHELKAEGYCFDDDYADNISQLNPWWGELTAIHRILHLNEFPLVGNAQYRRHWGDKELGLVHPDCLYLSHPCHFPFSLQEQFEGYHYFPGYAMTMSVAEAGKLPFSPAELQGIWQQNRFQGGPMAIGSWSAYKRLMTALFDCLWPIWEAYEGEIKALQGYDRRAIAFLSERLLSGLVLMPERFVGRIPLQYIKMHYVGP